MPKLPLKLVASFVALALAALLLTVRFRMPIKTYLVSVHVLKNDERIYVFSESTVVNRTESVWEMVKIGLLRIPLDSAHAREQETIQIASYSHGQGYRADAFSVVNSRLGPLWAKDARTIFWADGETFNGWDGDQILSVEATAAKAAIASSPGHLVSTEIAHAGWSSVESDITPGFKFDNDGKGRDYTATIGGTKVVISITGGTVNRIEKGVLISIDGAIRFKEVSR